METITFTVKAGTPDDRRDALFASIGAMAGVQRVGLVAPGSRSELGRRMAYVATSDADPAALLRALERERLVEDVSVPAVRHAVA